MARKYSSLEINKFIEHYQLASNNNLLPFLSNNPERLDVPTLIRITELCNGKREENEGFYTNKYLVNEIMDKLPDFNQDTIRILEPSVGAGSFIPFILIRYAHIPHVIIDVVDIDPDSIENFKIILGMLDVPDNFTINIICNDFLLFNNESKYNLAIGNPPFAKLKRITPEIKKVLNENYNKSTKDLAELFLEKCLRICDHVALVLNKTILSSEEFSATRDMLSKMRISHIIDFGRYGFTGVSIETICMIISPKQKPAETSVYSMKFSKLHKQRQDYITDPKFPYFIIYRNENFDKVADSLLFDVFEVFRDRQITKALTTKEKNSDDDLWVIKARNLDDNGSGVSHIKDYDVYLSRSKAESLSVQRFVGDTTVYLTPNMTYNPRIVENVEGIIPDGSVAVLTPKNGIRLTSKQKAFFTTPEYREFYSIARNLSTQSINVDKTSVFFYGILNHDN